MASFNPISRLHRHVAVLLLASTVLIVGCTTVLTNTSQVTAGRSVVNISSPITSAWVSVLPKTAPPVFQGELEPDRSQTHGYSPLYPAGDLVTFGVSIAVHAAIGSSQQTDAMMKRQASANEVLAAYRPIISDMDITHLLNGAFSKLKNSDQPLHTSAKPSTGTEPHIKLSAHYGMTQNQSAIALYLIGEGTLETGEKFTHLIKVMSPATTVAPADKWLAHSGRGLKQESAALMAEGIKLLVMDVKGKLPSGAEKTVRYQYGLENYTERARTISTDCGRLVMRNLRNWVLSVPTDGSSCVSTAQY